MRPSPCPPKTAADLEYPRILRAVADRCASDAGRARALALPFLDERADVERALAEIREATSLDDAGTPLPRAATPLLDGPSGSDSAVARARVGASLSAGELCATLKALQHVRALRRFVRARREEIPNLAAACDASPSATADLDALLDELDRCFEADGTLSDRASQRLADLRSERKSARARILLRLEELIGRYKDILQDAFFTEREGRYVLPVRADAHERFPGIVHGASAGGGTLFVEPRVVVPMGNRQKVLDAQVVAEEDAILLRLSGLVAASVDALVDALDALAHADVRGASAALARELQLSQPILTDDATLALRKARHPLLQLDGVKVVPSDVDLASGAALVVSGPNAGGKTVALKTVGLAALMVRAGLPIPAGRDSTIGLFDEVLTDVGDDQSLTKNLSTFSAHVRNLADIVARTHVGSLVLLDELASGTDPREGEALATAVLESLVARGGAVACTTHYERLKVVALEDPRFRNASVGFDLETMSPTFRLALGVPGASSALVVARRFGIPPNVVERAESLLSKETSTMSAVLRKLEEERLQVERAREALEKDRAALDDDRAALEAERERVARKEGAALEREASSLIGEVRQAREELRVAKSRMRSAKLDARDLAAMERDVDRAASAVSIGGRVEAARAEPADRAGFQTGEIAPGMKVFVPRLKTDAEVLEVLSGGQLRVAAGPLKLLTSVAEVRRPGGGAKSGGKSESPASGRAKPSTQRGARGSSHVFDAAADADVPMQTSDNTVDLRGLRAHEAIALAEQFLDRCIGASKRVAFLIHGHGTGALRQSIRDMLRGSSYVERSRPGEPREGGDGVTVVWLK